MTTPALLRLNNVTRHFGGDAGGWFRKASGRVRAVDGVSLSIGPGTALGLVGESGCGKSTLGNVAAGLIPATGGEVFYRGSELGSMREEERKAFRRDVQCIFQDAAGSLNPRRTVGAQLEEPLQIHTRLEKQRRREAVRRTLSLVSLSDEHAARYPHELSGGQRQRVVIARAMMLSPALVVCDEPTSALDVSVQAQIINLLADLKKSEGLAYLFISHNLSVVRTICESVAVMYLGRVVETAPREELFGNPAHPYTAMLLAANPVPDPERRDTGAALSGETPSPYNPPSGCTFHPRCPRARPECARAAPPARDVGAGHSVCCHHPEVCHESEFRCV